MKRILIGIAALMALAAGLALAAATSPSANFTWSPSAPTVNQTVQFADSSTGTIRTWAWTFGDGTGNSTLKNPTHVYSKAGTYTVTLKVTGAGTSSTRQQGVTVTAGSGSATAFDGNIVLGSPTNNSIKVKIFSPDQSGLVWIAYGAGAACSGPTESQQTLVAATPLVLTATSLQSDTQYSYYLCFQADGARTPWQSPLYTFHTARLAGSAFTFTVQSDPHLDGNSDLATYRLTLDNVLGGAPDFHVDLGDTFMTEKYSTPLTSTEQRAPDAATVNARYVYERGNFGRITHSVPLFLVNGNHDGELGWLKSGNGGQNVAIWATTARQKYFANPTPDSFYGGDPATYPYVQGQRAAWYAWQWGDAHFIVLDPYWNSPGQPGKDSWNLTLGKTQYDWLTATLRDSTAKYKFVFIHNLVGGLDGQMRGGIEAAPYFEWGGRNADGTDGFATRRPGWAMPIHALLKKYQVTAVFHGHDHLYVRQVLDGIVYQEVPQPSAINYSSGPNLASQYHYASGTILSSSGHLRITVTPEGVTGRYVRTWIPANATGGRVNGEVADTWTAPVMAVR